MAEIRKPFPPPAEVTSYFEAKALRPAFSWLDVWGEEHAHAFTVAKATELEVLTAFRDTIGTAIREGQGFENWKEEIRRKLTAAGWWQPRTVSDPAGILPDRTVNFASPRRLRTIFWSNMNTARAAGQWQRAQRTKRTLPYLLYMRTASSDPREEHLAWVGTILPVDDDFWRTHFPPNGWLCKCQVMQITARDAERRLGLDENETGIRYTTERPETPTVRYRNKRTGEITEVPLGIDPGWQTNPGLARTETLIRHIDDKLAAASDADATIALTDLWADPYQRLAVKLARDFDLPAGRSERMRTAFNGRPDSAVVAIGNRTIAEAVEEGALAIEDAAQLPRMIEGGTLLAEPAGDAARRRLVARFGSTWLELLVELAENGTLRIASFRREDQAVIERLLKDAGIPLEDVVVLD